MNRIPMLDGSTRQSKYLQVALGGAYALFAVAGGMLMLSPVVPGYGREAYIYASFMVVGGLLSSFGASTLHWPGEFTGLPLLGSGIVAFSIEIAVHAHMPTYLAIAHLALISGTALMMSARWRRALASYRFAHHVAHLRPGERA